MIFDLFSDLNWLAVLVAAIAYFILGALWYADFLFGKQYRAALGLDPEQTAKPEPGPMVLNLVMWFIAALVLGLVSLAVGADDWIDGALLGLVVAFGFIGTNRIVGNAYGADNPKLMPINAPYTLLGFALMGVILAVWQ
jgi:ABC-type Fe3+ transport system permease subunit